jgi:hypothetical protein
MGLTKVLAGSISQEVNRGIVRRNLFEIYQASGVGEPEQVDRAATNSTIRHCISSEARTATMLRDSQATRDVAAVSMAFPLGNKSNTHQEAFLWLSPTPGKPLTHSMPTRCPLT